MTSKYIAGIDYSYSCPSLAISDIENATFRSTEFFYITKIVKHVGDFENLHGSKEYPYDNQQQRFDLISNHFIGILSRYDITDVAIEGYSYGSSAGQVFDIAENCGLLKHKLFKNNINIHIFPPSEIKKFATSKGNADKQKMFDAFLEQESVDFRDSISYTKSSIDNPVSDIVDSYYILKLLSKKLTTPSI